MPGPRFENLVWDKGNCGNWTSNKSQEETVDSNANSDWQILSGLFGAEKALYNSVI